MKKRNWIAFSAAAALALAGCSTAAETSAASGSASTSAAAGSDSTSASSDTADSNTITGKVTAIDGNSVTISVGTMNTPEGGADASGMMHGGKGGMKEDSTSGATSSSAPDSTTGATPSESQSSGAASGSTETTSAVITQTGSTVTSNSVDTTTSATVPSQGSGTDSGSDSTSGATMGRPDGGRGFSLFEESGETKTIDLSGATITGTDSTDSLSVSDIAVDDIIVITLGTDGKAETVTIQQLPDMDQKQMRPDSGSTEDAAPTESSDSSSQQA